MTDFKPEYMQISVLTAALQDGPTSGTVEMNSDGSFTYFASDIAYHKNKFDRGFRNLIDVWGADHGGYVKRVAAAVAPRGRRCAKRSAF